MPIDKGREGNDRPPDDWERIDLEFEKRARAQRAYDASHDPSAEWEAAARPLGPDYGKDRPAIRTVTPDQVEEMVEMWGQRNVDKLFASGRLVLEQIDASPPAKSESRSESTVDDRDRPARFEPTIASRLRELAGKTGEKTDGLLVDNERHPVWDRPMRSGLDGPAADVGRQTLGLPLRKAAIMSHIEAHAAAEMHKQGLSEATLYVNKNPCSYPGGYGCDPNLPRMLPPEARLTGYWRDDREGPAPPGEVGPILDSRGRTWRGKVFRAEEGSDQG